MVKRIALDLPDALWEWVDGRAQEESLLPEEFIRDVLRAVMEAEVAEGQEEPDEVDDAAPEEADEGPDEEGEDDSEEGDEKEEGEDVDDEDGDQEADEDPGRDRPDDKKGR